MMQPDAEMIDGYDLFTSQPGSSTAVLDATASSPSSVAPRPSARFVQEVSQLLDTDPHDMLAELGYSGHGSDSAQQE